MLKLVYSRVFIVYIILNMLLLSGCNKDEGKAETKTNKEKPDLRVPVEVDTIERGLIESFITAYANLETESNVKVIARTSDLVSKILVEEGDSVKKGDVLLILENDEQLITLNKVSSNLEKNESEFTRQKHLKQRNLVSDKDFANAKNMYNISKLDKEKAQLDYDYTIVRAPIDGVVTQRLVNIGDKVKTNDHLFSLVDFNTIVARVFLPEENLPKIQIGQRAVITSQSFLETPFEGSVLRVAPVIDSRSGTFKVTIAIKPEQFLRPGMYVNVSLLIDQSQNAVLLPKKALIYDDEQIFVYKVAKGKARRVYVQPKLSNTQYIEPKKGISQGDIVVIAGQNSLKDGAKVRVIEKSDSDMKETKMQLIDKQNVATSNNNEKTSDLSAIPVKRENESKKEFRARMKAYIATLPESERAEFIEKRKQQRQTTSEPKSKSSN